MSYILDALRKADAERERGHVPGIHAQPVFSGAPQAAARPGTIPWGWIAAAALALSAVAALAWFWLAGGPRDATPLAAGPAAVSAPAPAATPGPTPAPTSAPLTASTASPAAVTAAPPAAPVGNVNAAVTTAPASPRIRAEPTRKPAAAPAAVRDETLTASAMSPSPSPVTGRSAAPLPTAAASAARLYTVAELPDDVRRQLPQVAVGGSAYSPKPANRILIVNGQVLHEGERITPELMLEQIRMRSAVLAFRGYRYEMAF